MVKVQKRDPQRKKIGQAATAVEPTRWEEVFAFLRKHRHHRLKWSLARSMVPGVSITTLKARFKANNTAATQKGPQCVLGEDVENAIAEWPLVQADVGNACPVELLYPKARGIAKRLIPHQDLGNWVGGRPGMRASRHATRS